MSNVYIYSKNHYSYHLQLGSSDILAPIPKMLHFHPFKKNIRRNSHHTHHPENPRERLLEKIKPPNLILGNKK